MADDAEDVLDLSADVEIDDLDEGDDGQTDGEVGEGEDEETVITLGDEEAAPASETESSVIRDLRKANRELAKKISAYERSLQPQKVDPGPKPTLADCEYDEEQFEVRLDEWKARKRDAEQAERAEQEAAERERQTWESHAEAYRAEKASLKVKDFDAAEETVFAAISDQHKALLMRSGKGAALVALLASRPSLLEQFSNENLADAAMTVGELRGKVQVGTRTVSSPERRVAGNAGGASGTAKRLEALKAKAAQTGNYDEYFAAKRAAGA